MAEARTAEAFSRAGLDVARYRRDPLATVRQRIAQMQRCVDETTARIAHQRIAESTVAIDDAHAELRDHARDLMREIGRNEVLVETVRNAFCSLDLARSLRENSAIIMDRALEALSADDEGIVEATRAVRVARSAPWYRCEHKLHALIASEAGEPLTFDDVVESMPDIAAMTANAEVFVNGSSDALSVIALSLNSDASSCGESV